MMSCGCDGRSGPNTSGSTKISMGVQGEPIPDRDVFVWDFKVGWARMGSGWALSDFKVTFYIQKKNV